MTLSLSLPLKHAAYLGRACHKRGGPYHDGNMRSAGLLSDACRGRRYTGGSTDVGLLGAAAQVASALGGAHAVEKAGLLWCRRAGFRASHRTRGQQDTAAYRKAATL